MMNELRECPMCGNKAHYQEWKIGQTTMGWRVICGGCSVMTANWHSKEAAAKCWNARAYDVEIERLRADAEIGRLVREMLCDDDISICDVGCADDGEIVRVENGEAVGVADTLLEALRKAKGESDEA